MSKLALLGGKPIFERALNWRTFWPPVEEATGIKLKDLYASRRWTAFDETESAFTQAFAAKHGAAHGIFMVNGTVTLQCALGAYGIGPGDEVIVPALTWYATAMAAHYLGARPVFVDIDRESLCIDPDKIAAAITERTKAIIPVHVYGSMADMDRIMAIAKKHRLRVIEDCAHMHGGVYGGKGIGSIGDVGSFSFQHSKTMASGEGGICITNDSEIAERIFRMKQIGYGPGQLAGLLGPVHDGPPPDLLCYPFRATAFQSLILLEQLKSLDGTLEHYRRSVQYLEKRLQEGTSIRFQTRGRKADRQGYFAWPMMFDSSDYADIPLSVIRQAVTAEGLPVGQAWNPVYRFILFNLKPEAYRIDRECAVTEQVGARVLILLHPYLGLETSEVERIADVIEKVAFNTDELRLYAKRAA